MNYLKRVCSVTSRMLCFIAACAAVLCFSATEAQAQSLPDVVKPPPSINLGSTSFYDGFGRTKPGLTILQYFRWTHDTQINDYNGIQNPKIVNPDLNVYPALTQFIVATKWHPFGGTAGFSVLVPIVDQHSHVASNSPVQLPNNGLGFGDIIAGPTYQSRFYFHKPTGPAATANPHSPGVAPAPFFAWRTQVLVQIPNGKFNPADSLNQGSGYWALTPYVAATYIVKKRLEFSTRLHYAYNYTTNKIANPPPIPHLTYVNGQAGQLVYGNFTTSYKFTRKAYFGANSYMVYQLSPDKTNGVNVGHARESQIYLGPGGGIDFSRKDTLNVNLYLQLEDHNTAAGPSLQLLYIHRF